MQFDPSDPGRTATRFAPEREAPESELEGLRATNRRQTLVIDKLSDTISALRSDVSALEAESAELRERNARLRSHAGHPITDQGERIEAALPLDVEAPAAARFVVAEFLRGRVSRGLLDTAQLLISELVSSSLRHNVTQFDQALLVRVAFEHVTWRLEVEDPGADAVLPPDPADRAERRGLGLNLVQKLSDGWGVEHAPGRGTRAWAYLPHAPLAAHPEGSSEVDQGAELPR